MNSRIKTPGQQLKEAREELGKTLSEMGVQTRISTLQLQGLEEDRYEKIPAPMYVRAFIKLYAQNLGIRHEPLVELYEQIRKGEPLGAEAESNAPPQPLQESIQSSTPEPEFATQPGPSRKSYTSPKTSTLKGYWETFKTNVPDVSTEALREWGTSPRVRYAGIGIVVLFGVLLAFRGCGGSSEEQESTPGERPEVNDPLLSSPEPVYFELPRSYQ